MLDVVKKALRISHNALDDEISDLIEAARHDLMLSGVSSEKANVDTDPLIKRAIITYVKANFIPDAKEAERFQLSYDMLRNHLTLAGDYK
ncbi:DNA-packaging protein [Bacillus pseudomycoides]|uniref:head-tail connector protein n=1 Tax=Bacillus pseudomycoides TaxID=64104 RepID=UPI00177E1CA5|nr:head-tail connector protein [Bacillus pseudomycoides]MBD5798408.1 DNA-packaging protein [Bacillus pseudomycoides]